MDLNPFAFKHMNHVNLWAQFQWGPSVGQVGAIDGSTAIDRLVMAYINNATRGNPSSIAGSGLSTERCIVWFLGVFEIRLIKFNLT